MSDDEIILTRAGYEKLKNDLDILLNETSKEMAESLADVREDTDPGEEPTFIDTMNDKQRLDDRIARLRTILARATVLDEDPDPDTASPGDRVLVVDLETKEKLHFDLLGSEEVAHGRRGVSIASPVGKALMGQKIGATIEVKVPDGVARYRIRDITRIPAE
jgi:transcription elongation factor GreA